MAALRIIDSAAGLAGLEPAWSSFTSASASPMQQFPWALACAESFAPSARLHVAALEDEGRTLAIAPLVARSRSRFEALGVGELGEPSDFLYDAPDSLERLAGALADAGSPLRLERLPAASPTAGALRQAYRWRGMLRVVQTDSYPYIPLDARWFEPESQVNAGRRSDFRRAMRHAQRLGPVTFEVVAPDASRLEPLLDEAYRVECAGWKGRRGSALAVDTRRGGFFRRYARLAAERGVLRLCFMRIGERAVAMQFAVECGRRFWLLKIGYDEGCARCSPGTLLMLHTLRDSALRGLESYEFLGAREPWTDVWTRAERGCVALSAYPLSRRGVLCFTADLTRAIRSRLPRLAPAAA